MVTQDEKSAFLGYAYNAGLRYLTPKQINKIDECYTFADDVLSSKGITSVPKQLRDELALTYMCLVVQQGQEIEKIGDSAAAAIDGKSLDATMIPLMQPYLVAGRAYAEKIAGKPQISEQEKQASYVDPQLRKKFENSIIKGGKETVIVDAGQAPADGKYSKGKEYPAANWNEAEQRFVYRNRSSAFQALVYSDRSVLRAMIMVERSEEHPLGKYPTLASKAMGDMNRAGGAYYIQGRIPTPWNMSLGDYPTPDNWRTTVMINLRDELTSEFGAQDRSWRANLERGVQKYKSYIADIVEFASPTFESDISKWYGVAGTRLSPEFRAADQRVIDNRWQVSLDWMLYIGDNYTTSMRTKFDRFMNRAFGMADEEKQKSEALSNAWKEEFVKLISYNKGNAEFLAQAREGLEHMAKRHKNELDPMHNAIQSVIAQVNAAEPRRYTPAQRAQENKHSAVGLGTV
jgi:hypothetical protein